MSAQSEQDSDRVARVLVALDPAREARLTTSGIDGALGAIGAAIVTQRRHASSRRWSLRVAGARRRDRGRGGARIACSRRDCCDAGHPDVDSHQDAPVGRSSGPDPARDSTCRGRTSAGSRCRSRPGFHIQTDMRPGVIT